MTSQNQPRRLILSGALETPRAPGRGKRGRARRAGRHGPHLRAHAEPRARRGRPARRGRGRLRGRERVALVEHNQRPRLLDRGGPARFRGGPALDRFVRPRAPLAPEQRPRRVHVRRGGPHVQHQHPVPRQARTIQRRACLTPLGARVRKHTHTHTHTHLTAAVRHASAERAMPAASIASPGAARMPAVSLSTASTPPRSRRTWGEAPRSATLLQRRRLAQRLSYRAWQESRPTFALWGVRSKCRARSDRPRGDARADAGRWRYRAASARVSATPRVNFGLGATMRLAGARAPTGHSVSDQSRRRGPACLRSAGRALASMTSRVVPGVGETSAAGRRARRLSSVLFPALGAPTSATDTPLRSASALPSCASSASISPSTPAARSLPGREGARGGAFVRAANEGWGARRAGPRSLDPSCLPTHVGPLSGPRSSAASALLSRRPVAAGGAAHRAARSACSGISSSSPKSRNASAAASDLTSAARHASKRAPDAPLTWRRAARRCSCGVRCKPPL
jgi:hypothetical protein